MFNPMKFARQIFEQRKIFDRVYVSTLSYHVSPIRKIYEQCKRVAIFEQRLFLVLQLRRVLQVIGTKSLTCAGFWRDLFMN